MYKRSTFGEHVQHTVLPLPFPVRACVFMCVCLQSEG